MNSEWKQVRLGDFIDSCLGKMLDQKKNRGKFHPYLGNSNVRWGGFDLSNLAEMKFEDTEHERYSLKKGDLVVCEGGEPGRCAIWEDEIPGIKIQKALHRIRTLPGLVSGYLYYWFLFAGKTGSLEPYFTGTTIKHLTGRSLADLTITLPPVKHQEKCALILSSIDRIINNNNKINQTLEQMAQALFKSWFVDFEPVKTKIAVLEAGGSQEEAILAAMTAISGKDTDALVVFEREYPEQYAELKATAELFPSAMQESGQRKIPAGWNILSLDEVAHFQNGLALQKFRPENEFDYLPVVKIAQLKKGFADGEEKASSNIKKECVIDNGDVIFSWSGSLMVDIWCGGRAALNQHLFKVTSVKYPKWLYYKYTTLHLNEFQRIAEAKAVTMGHIKREHLSQAKCCVPSLNMVNKISSFFEPIIKHIIALRLESQKLEQLRDTLLPKLLSGEITLPETEQAVSEATHV